MASPQKENGYTPIAHELLRALIRAHLSGKEWAAFMTIALHSYGQSKKETTLSYAEIASEMGTYRARAVEAIQKLVVRKTVLPLTSPENRTTLKNTYKIQKDYQVWGGTETRTSTGKRTSAGTENRTTSRTRAKQNKEKSTYMDPGTENRTTFVPPTPQEAEEYAASQGFDLDGEKFCAHYGAVGWVRGKSKIKNWKLCVITWKRNTFENGRTKEKPDWIS